jgi:ribosomal protein S18 acetylase RimI-like enzyme
MTTQVGFQIRPAEAADRDRVQDLWEACGLARGAPDEWDALMEGPTSVVLAADRDGELIGAAVATFDGWRAYIYHVAVGRQWRREGIGHDLVAAAEQYLLSAGARYVYVMVNQENTEGLALVGSVGYLPEGEIVLAKRLANRLT